MLTNNEKEKTLNPFTNEEIEIDAIFDKSINGSDDFLQIISILRKIKDKNETKSFKSNILQLLRIVLNYNEYKTITKHYILPTNFLRYDTIENKEDIPVIVDSFEKINANIGYFFNLIKTKNSFY